MQLTPLRKHSNFTAIPHRQMVARIDTIPLERRLKVEFYELFRKWSDSSGPSWSVARTKALRDCVMQSRAHGQLHTKPEWVATTPAGNLKGTYGRLWRVAMASFEGFKAVLNLLNIYTVWTQNSLDSSELNDVMAEVNQAPVVRGSVGTPGSRQLRKLKAVWLSRGAAFNRESGLKRPTRVKCKPCVPLSQVLPGKKSHVRDLATDIVRLVDSLFYNYHPEPVRQALGGYFIEADRNVAYAHICKWGLNGHPPTDRELEWYREMFADNSANFVVEKLSSNQRKNIAGRVNYTLEPGLKSRYFAAPNIVLQRALEPLKDALFKVIDRLPWDCTLHQRKADKLIVNAMRDGKTVHTVDMSKATDNFPWEYQKAVLSMVLNTRDENTRQIAGLFTTIVEKGVWHLGTGRTLKRLRWSKGQPLGLGPSFPLFTLTHGLVLLALNEGTWGTDFFVLGDDVIILNDELAVKYKKWLSTVGVPISSAKTFSSSRVGQFAGKTYTPYGSFWTPKWLKYTKSTALDACAWWYPGLSSSFPKDRKTIDWVLSLPEPLGRGWNPTGLPLSARLTDDIVDMLVERDKLRQEKSRPTSHAIQPNLLRKSFRLAGYGDDMVFSMSDLCLETDRAVRLPTRQSTTTLPSVLYAPETEVPGFPYVRFRTDRVDPYSKGTLQVWKSVLAQQPSCRD